MRAAVDDQRVARGLGINVGAVFAVTFAVGSGLAGLGGALGAEILGLDPTFPLRYMIYFLIVVTVGGTSSIIGPFVASILLGIGDVAGKYYVPTLGAFVIYAIMIVVLIWRPQGLFARSSGAVTAHARTRVTRQCPRLPTTFRPISSAAPAGRRSRSRSGSSPLPASGCSRTNI